MRDLAWLISASAMLPAFALVAWLRFADDPSDGEMHALVASQGSGFQALLRGISVSVDRSRGSGISPLFHQPGFPS
jgi:hypothetical protein